MDNVAFDSNFVLLVGGHFKLNLKSPIISEQLNDVWTSIITTKFTFGE